MKTSLPILRQRWWSIVLVGLGLLCLLVVSACGSRSTPEPTVTPTPPTATAIPPTVAEPPTTVPPTPTATEPPVTIVSIAEDIADGVGKVVTIVGDNPDRVIFVFEETHISPAGQVEIAIMLNRLYERYGLRHIGLEGHFADEGNLDPSWYCGPALETRQPIRPREDVAVQLLEEGEISSSEMMALVYCDNITVAGIEREDEYSYEPPDEAWSANLFHLFGIAQMGMSPTEIDRFNELVAEEKILEAIEFAISTDEWTDEIYALLNDETTILSCEKHVEIMNDIEAKAHEVDANVRSEDRENLRALRKFFESCIARSETMVKHTFDLLEQSHDAPVAMIVGAAHTEGVSQLITEKGASHVVIRGIALEEKREEGDLHSQAYARKLDSLSVDPLGQLGALLDGRRKPRSIIDEVWFQSKASIYLLADLLARAVAAGEVLPFTDTLSRLPPLEGITLNQDSIEVEGDEVIFSVEALDRNGEQVTIWVRARADREMAAQLLEDRLLEARARVEERGKPSEEPEPEPSAPALTPISLETVAKVAASEAEIRAAPLG